MATAVGELVVIDLCEVIRNKACAMSAELAARCTAAAAVLANYQRSAAGAPTSPTARPLPDGQARHRAQAHQAPRTRRPPPLPARPRRSVET